MINRIKNIYAKLVSFFKGLYFMAIASVKNLYNRITHKQIQKSRKVNKAKFLYYYVIFGSMGSLFYFIASLVFDLPGHWSFTPVYLLLAWYLLWALIKNRKLIWVYVSDKDQGKLLMYLNENTHFSEDHKMKLLNWVYLKPGRVRLETYNRIYERIVDKKDVSDAEKALVKLKPVPCPQQLKDGWNEAMLVQALKYAHFNISVLDPDLRETMNLTDDNLLAFDINKEMDKARSTKYQKMVETGKKAAAKLNGEDDICQN